VRTVKLFRCLMELGGAEMPITSRLVLPFARSKRDVGRVRDHTAPILPLRRFVHDGCLPVSRGFGPPLR